MDFIPLNIVSGYRGSVAAGRNFWEGKHQNNSHIPVSDAIVALYQDETARITSVFLTTKRLDDFGITKHETLTLDFAGAHQPRPSYRQLHPGRRQWFLSLHGLEGHRCKAVEDTKGPLLR